MALLTPLTLDDAKRIGARYGLDVARAEGLLAGSVNSNFALTLASGERVFLRVFEEQTSETAASEARMLEHLASHGVKTPRPLARLARAEGEEGESAVISEHAGKPVALFPWVVGASLCQKLVTREAARKVGAALARVHVAGASYEGAPVSRFSVPNLRERLRRIDAIDAGRLDGDKGELARDVEGLKKRLDEWPQRPPEAGVGVIHGDLFRDNVLFDGGEISALLDFESASRGSVAFDLGVTLLAWCYGDALDVELCRALVAGYTSERPLSIDERRALFDEARLAAVRFAVTRITDYELRPRGVSGYRDYRRFLQRLAAIEAMGAAGLLTALGL